MDFTQPLFLKGQGRALSDHALFLEQVFGLVSRLHSRPHIYHIQTTPCFSESPHYFLFQVSTHPGSLFSSFAADLPRHLAHCPTDLVQSLAWQVALTQGQGSLGSTGGPLSLSVLPIFPTSAHTLFAACTPLPPPAFVAPITFHTHAFLFSSSLKSHSARTRLSLSVNLWVAPRFVCTEIRCENKRKFIVVIESQGTPLT